MQTMPRHSSAPREYQRTFNFPPPDYHSPRDPAVPHRREAAEEVLAHSSAPEIRKLIETGQLTVGTHVQEIPVATFVRNNRRALRWFVQRLANGGCARDASHQQDAWALLERFNDLADLPLALALEKLGFCDSTTSFGQTLGASGDSVALWGFRMAMQKYRQNMRKNRSGYLSRRIPPSPSR